MLKEYHQTKRFNAHVMYITHIVKLFFKAYKRAVKFVFIILLYI